MRIVVGYDPLSGYVNVGGLQVFAGTNLVGIEEYTASSPSASISADDLVKIIAISKLSNNVEEVSELKKAGVI